MKIRTNDMTVAGTTPKMDSSISKDTPTDSPIKTNRRRLLQKCIPIIDRPSGFGTFIDSEMFQGHRFGPALDKRLAEIRKKRGKPYLKFSPKEFDTIVEEVKEAAWQSLSESAKKDARVKEDLGKSTDKVAQ